MYRKGRRGGNETFPEFQSKRIAPANERGVWNVLLLLLLLLLLLPVW